MIDIKQAAQSASNFIGGLYPAETVSDVRLEEVELDEDEHHWLITLSFPTPDSSRNLFLGTNMKRQYKIFKVHVDTGKVISMKIRELSHATP